jgi:catechol 2,3-dioxygenase-like lactoylglutathione lyase family enzyme
MRLSVFSAAAALVAALATPAPAKSVSVSMLHLNVTNLQQSLALYRDVLGMELIAPVAAPRAGTGLLSEPGAMLQTAQLRVPGGSFQMELVEWTGTPLKPVQPRIQDPGEVMLAFNVRDFNAKLEGAKKLGLKVVTKNGEPYTSEGRGGKNVAVMLRDPSGFIVELTDITANPATAASAPAGGITSVAVWFTVQDLAQTVKFYDNVFGFTMMEPAAANPANDRIKALFNDPSIATMRNVRATFPGTDVTVNFQEFTGPDRKPARHRVQDPGGPILLVNVDDFPATVMQIPANGGLIGDGPTSATLAADARVTWARDPNGILLRVSPPAPARGAGGRQ